MKRLIVLCGLIASSQLMAAQQITLEDGRKVLLNDDFTWHYVTAPTASETPANSAAAKPVVAAIPVVQNQTGSLISLNSDKPTMQLSDSGVDILLAAASYQDGQLVIPTSLTNQSRQAVITVELEVEVLDSSGAVLSKQKAKVWSSIKRMADTYLRPEQIATGKPIKVDVESASQYQIKAKVVNIETR
ncbi:DUF3157 family protein [Vibrio ouci]|uniref:DUF3157 family protein n=1 Tax=Vibrio ouci TaxID=2499078 RepID=A0A4Y8WE04_9VIBR|nr:DUF3157 family protein [Vibrio ouci]TFH90863.1 DUF3157 family protein [Vibrio ouci]